MTRLSIHPEEAYSPLQPVLTKGADIASELDQYGVRFEQPAVAAAGAGVGAPGAHPPTAEAITAAYADLIAQQRRQYGYTLVDTVTVSSDRADLAALRGKFLSEHTHLEDEARFMVDGAGTFYLRHAGRVLILELCAGDLVSVPAGMRHWFDMGECPRFTAIRFFTQADGWVGQFTGDPIAERFPLYAGPSR